MLTTKYNVLDRAQFQLLREAKVMIKKEFDRDLVLQNDDVLDKLYEYAMESREEALFNILYEFKQLSANSRADSQPQVKVAAGRLSVGDIIGGKRCVAIYRGKPVFA